MADISSNEYLTPWRIEHRNVPLADTGDYDGLTQILSADGREVVQWWNATDEEEKVAERIVRTINDGNRLQDELREARLETARTATEALRTIGSAVETPAECPGHYKVAARNVCTMFPHCLCSPEARAAEAAEDARCGRESRVKAPEELGICPTCKAGVGYDGKRIHLNGCPAVKTTERTNDGEPA